MRISRYIPSMFQRRLLLLASLGLVGLLPPMLQMARLTIAKGPEHLAEAQKRLINEQWLETIRGRIIDRKGRVLALDEASADIAADYPVITGRWAYAQAARKARRVQGSRWAELSPDQREELIQGFVPEFESRLDGMWDRLCAIAGISRADLDDRREQVRAEVQALAATVTERARQRLEDQLRRGEELTEEVRTADVRRQIREQTSSHVLLRNVPEPVAFALRPLTDRSPLGVFERDPESVPLIGLQVVETTRRAYPLDTLEIDVDLSSFPAPLKAQSTQAVRVEGVAMHAIGWMKSKVQAEDIARRPRVKPDGSVDRGHYRLGDSVGLGGAEQAAEDRLRGLRGVRTVHRDTEQVERLEPTPGEDVRLTIDAFLQARIQALFDPSLGLAIVQPWHRSRPPDPIDPANPRPMDLPLATPLNGSVVVLDVATGDILAMVSAPSFSHDRIAREPRSVMGDSLRRPFLNRAIDVAYPPGSIVKPLILAAAAGAGKVGLDERIRCTGHFFPDKPMLFRCWIYKQTRNTVTHESQFEDLRGEGGGGLDGADAIRVSCNIYFFEMGKRLGSRGIHDWYTRFGVGPSARPWNLYGLDPMPVRDPAESDEQWRQRRESWTAQRALIHEYPGALPDPERSNIQEAILMGIGQGPIAWTPLHAADAYATIARGGQRLTPRLFEDAPQTREDLGVPRAAIAKALEGLRASASSQFGTTFEASYDMPDGSKKRDRIFNVQDEPNIAVWAKSGTADTNPFEADLDESGAPVKYDADHAWCVFLVGERSQPKYAVAVVVEHGGSGGRVAGPIGNQVIRALMAEGYLGSETRAGGGPTAGVGGRP